MTKVNSLTKLAGEKLMGFIEDQDQNLKFLGLHALKKLAFGNPKLLQGSLEKIIKCLDDKDITIRSEALSILTFLVSPDNIVRIVDFILDRCSVGVPDEDWLNLVVETVVEMCKTDDYSGIEDFEWYFSVLLDLALLPLSVFRHGALVENEMVIITTRVNGVRSYAVDSLHEILNSSQLLNSDSRLSTQSKILKAAAFVCGEYPHWLKNKLETVTLLLGESIASLPADVQCACVVAAGKIAAFCRVPCKRHSNLLNGEEGDLPVDESTENVIPWLTGESKGLEKFIQSMHPDVQERANFAYFSVSKCEDAGSALYENELVTVAEGSQKLLDVPDELCLDTPFCADASKLLDLTDSEDSDNAASSEDNFEFEYRIEQEALRERKRREEVDPFYLKEGSTTQETEATKEDQTTSHRRYRKDRQSQKKTYTIKRDLHQPDHPETLATKKGRNAMANEIDDATIKFSNIDLTQGVGADEVLRGTAGRTDFTKKEKKKAVPTRKFETIFDANHLTLRVACVSCKCKKDGFHLKHMVEVSNNGKHSVLNVALATDAEDDCAESNILFSDNSSGDNVLQSSSQLTERVVAGACERHEVDIVIVKLPESFVDPVLLWVAFEIEGSLKKEKASLQLACVDFLGEDVPIPSSEEFLSVAGGPLSSALVLSAFLECNNDQISEGTATLQSRLHLQLVDIFNDCATLVGRVHCRKANSDTAWVAVLLRVADQEGAHGVSIHVKSLFACVSEGLIYEIVNIIGNTISQ
ncbi:Adaptin N terminal region containing protein, putative [Angomonas deanei]|uniref:Adaptin N terminal region containing protein, putative n=1 Tax=Angomonas deanei TaxID=59799 RepID=A0A7G2CDS9_9TRYP|nr:Adaptin N terminal region containing protein, putative [Angomonas deanei]